MASKGKQLMELYKQVPKVNCQGKCTWCCTPIHPPDVEVANIAKRYPEATRMKQAPQSVLRLVDDPSRCVLLTPAGRCKAYSVRPLICRIWGASEYSACPHGCKPERVLSEFEVEVLLAKVRAISSGQMPSLESLKKLADERTRNGYYERLKPVNPEWLNLTIQD